MKKVLFLMFLLFLIGLGAAGVKAQVRIGGNTPPNPAAVLDLNATDAATATKGLALPRILLTSDTMQITPGVANLNGMLAYNKRGNLPEGLYMCISNVWRKVDAVPTPSPLDSGLVLMSNGQFAVWSSNTKTAVPITDTLRLKPIAPPATFVNILDTAVIANFPVSSYQVLIVPNLLSTDLCSAAGTTLALNASFRAGAITIERINLQAVPSVPVRVRCYRPSF